MSNKGLAIGSLVGKYKITGLLGHGGMSIVYSGLDVSLLRPVAIKLLTRAADRGQDVVERLLLEARAAARLNHPNVVTIYELQNNSHGCYLVLELLDDGSVQSRLKERGPFPWRDATRIVADACRGLECAHAAKIIHRDVKPSNILLNRQGVAKLSDFGLTLAPQLDGRSPATSSATLLGTPQFMSPEQCTQRDVDERADLYSLGATYFALLTGRPPFDAADATMIMYAHCTQPFPDPRRQAPDVPEACVEVLRKATAKSRLDRYADASQMLADLLSIVEERAAPPTAVVPPPLSPAPVVVAATSSSSSSSVAEIPVDADPPTLERTGRSSDATLETRRRWVRRAALGAAAGALSWAGWSALREREESNDGDSPQRVESPRPFATTAAGSSERSPGSLLLVPVTLPKFAPRPDVRCVCAGRRLLVAGCADGQVQVFAREDGTLLRAMRHVSEVESVAISPDGTLIVAGGRKSPQVSVWEAATGRALGEFSAASNICSLAFAAPTGKLAVASEKDLALYEFHADRGRFRLVARIWERQYVVNQVAFSADGRRLAACTNDNAATVWDWPALKPLPIPQRPNVSRLTTVAVSRRGDRVLLGSHEGALHRWDVERGESQLVRDVRLGSIAAAAFSPVTDTVVLGGEWGGPLRLFDLNAARSWSVPARASGSVRCLNFSPDGELLAAAFSEGAIRLWRCTLAAPNG